MTPPTAAQVQCLTPAPVAVINDAGNGALCNFRYLAIHECKDNTMNFFTALYTRNEPEAVHAQHEYMVYYYKQERNIYLAKFCAFYISLPMYIWFLHSDAMIKASSPFGSLNEYLIIGAYVLLFASLLALPIVVAKRPKKPSVLDAAIDLHGENLMQLSPEDRVEKLMQWGHSHKE